MVWVRPEKSYKFVRYCIKCKKRFMARMGSIKVCDDCNPQHKVRELNKKHKTD